MALRGSPPAEAAPRPVGRQFRLVLPDGRVVVAEGKGTAWFVYPEDDPGNPSAGTLDGEVVAELLGYEYGDTYPRQFEEWADNVVGEAGALRRVWDSPPPPAQARHFQLSSVPAGPSPRREDVVAQCFG